MAKYIFIIHILWILLFKKKLFSKFVYVASYVSKTRFIVWYRTKMNNDVLNWINMIHYTQDRSKGL